MSVMITQRRERAKSRYVGNDHTKERMVQSPGMSVMITQRRERAESQYVCNDYTKERKARVPVCL